jgi:hypothetical protein
VIILKGVFGLFIVALQRERNVGNVDNHDASFCGALLFIGKGSIVDWNTVVLADTVIVTVAERNTVVLTHTVTVAERNTVVLTHTVTVVERNTVVLAVTFAERNTVTITKCDAFDCVRESNRNADTDSVVLAEIDPLFISFPKRFFLSIGKCFSVREQIFVRVRRA